ncbi:MAG: cation transporter [Candidatus Omnitrophica bacterium]|nr:cation transporter [Candidatus Omnitrophota bacterium]
MKKFSLWLASKTIKDYRKTSDVTVRAAYGALEGWVSVVVNVLIFLIKLLAGLSIKSISLIADAVHTLSDTMTSIVIIIGFKMAKKPSDAEHPFGHGRMESITTLIVAVLLFVAGIEICKSSVHSVIHPSTSSAPIWIIVIVFLTLVVKELMARFSFALGDIIDSSTLKADALHHRSDAFSTVLVIVALISSRLGFPGIDGIMGILVSLIIFYSAWMISIEAINPLLGEAPSKKLLKSIEKIALESEGVLGIHDIIYHKYGNTCIVSLHIEVSDKEPITKLHDLAEIVETHVGELACGQAIVHIDPINKDHPKYQIIFETIKQIVDSDPRITSFHELRIVGKEHENCNVIFDIALSDKIDEIKGFDIIQSVKRKFKKTFPEMKLIIKAEPKYSFNL